MINTREIAKEYRLIHWTQIMQERTQSGLSIKAFCKQVGICNNTYFYWQRRVRAAACEELMYSTPNEPIRTDNFTDVPNGWALCEVSSNPSEVATVLPIEINGCRILADMNTDSELLAKICKVLMSLC